MPPRPRFATSPDINTSGSAAQITMSFHPQTPQSPSQYSPSIDPTTSMTTSMTTVTTALPTPAHSVNGTSIPSESHDANMSDDPLSPLKRKRGSDDVGDRAQKKVQTEDRRLDIGNLHQDVGELHLLCRTPHLSSSVTAFEDLFERCGLTSFAAEYARVLPNGEKNALRKTYKGHIKRLGVSGHFDSVNEEWNRPDGFLALCHYPPEEWQIQQVRNKEVGNGFSSETLGRLERAITMGKGVVPKSLWDTSVLGDLGLGKADKQASARPTAPSTPAAVATNISRPKQPSLVQEAVRPKRAGKKRAYGDSSFEGYGEGFPDDEVQGSGYSTTEGDVGAPGQKRRKKTATPGQQYQQVRQPSYGPGMVGA